MKRYDPNKVVADESNPLRLLVAASKKDEEEKTYGRPTGMNTSAIKDITRTRASTISDAKSVFELLPDTKLAMDILVSSIMSPKDMMSNELLFQLPEHVAKDATMTALAAAIREWFTTEIKLDKICIPALEDMLFKTGSYPVVAVTVSAVDGIINAQNISLESIQDEFDDDLNVRNIGLLGSADEKEGGSTIRASLESIANGLSRNKEAIKVDDNITLVDNINLLKKPLMLDRIRESHTRALLDIGHQNISLESGIKNDKNEDVFKFELYPERNYKTTPLLELMGKGDGVEDREPLFFHPSSESVIPISVPGDVTRKVGFFIALDASGNPVSIASSKKHWERLRRYQHTEVTNDQGKSEIERIRKQLFGEETNKDMNNIQQLQQSYRDTIEEKLVRSIRNGVHGENAEVELDDDVVMLMMSRAMARRKTQLLYVPKELMVYMAFDYDDMGIGRSLLDSTRIMSSIRAMLLLSNTNASMKNSVPGSRVNIELDPKDPDPDATVEKVMTLYHENGKGKYPIGQLDVTDITESLNRSGTQVSVSNHPMYPNTKVEISETSKTVAKPDTELEESMRERHLQSWGVTPEMIDATADTDFAANIVFSNKLLVKRVTVYQDIFTSFLTDIVRMFMRLSPGCQASMVEAMKEAKVAEGKFAETIEEFMRLIEVGLPDPDSSKVIGHLEELEAYEAILEKALDAYFSEDFLDAMLDSDLEDSIVPTRAALKAYFLRNWMRTNNVMPEMEGVFTEEIDEVLKEHVDGVGKLIDEMSKMFRKTLKKGRKHDKKLDNEIEKEENEENEEDENLDDNNVDDPNASDDPNSDDNLDDPDAVDDPSATPGDDLDNPSDDNTPPEEGGGDDLDDIPGNI